jgi:hypothetical protein
VKGREHVEVGENTWMGREIEARGGGGGREEGKEEGEEGEGERTSMQTVLL